MTATRGKNVGESEDSRIRMSGCRGVVRRPDAALQRSREQQRERGEECKQSGECELNHASMVWRVLAGAMKQEPLATRRALSEVAGATISSDRAPFWAVTPLI